jgi:hypothetical protein
MPLTGNQPVRQAEPDYVVMNILDLTKATVLCGGVAFLIYTFPVVAQALLIGGLSLLWGAYAHKTIATLTRK